MNTKRIKDIRLFESDYENIDGTPFPPHFGTMIFIIDDKLKSTIARVCCQFTLKLRETNFQFPGFDHLYINFTTKIGHGEVKKTSRSKDKYHPWFQFIDCGMNMEIFSKQEDAEKIDNLIKHISLCLKTMAIDDESKEDVDNAVKCITNFGENLEISYRKVEDKGYLINVVLKIRNDFSIETFLVITGKDYYKNISLDINDLMQLSEALGKISVNRKQVIIKPKKNSYLENLKEITIDLC